VLAYKGKYDKDNVKTLTANSIPINTTVNIIMRKRKNTVKKPWSAHENLDLGA
jgi:ABC-type sulfate transport system substrate-binding protein